MDVSASLNFSRPRSDAIFSLWSSTVYLAAKIFARPDWEKLSAKVLHRFAADEQSPDGYWGEHNSAGPTTGYDYLTSTAIALYWESSRDPAALEALRRSTQFHEFFTWPDGTPVETINDRNRYWAPPMWGHFGFSNFPEGRRYAEFLTSFYGSQSFSLESLGLVAQNALNWHDGPADDVPQDRTAYAREMSATAGIRKSGPWTVCLSGIVSTQAQTKQFYLDRQGNLNVFHDKLGLIITGANSKRQPELATFSERAGEVENHLPLSSHLRLSDGGDHLALSYNTFFAEMKLPPFTQTLAFDVAVTTRSRTGDRRLGLQLCSSRVSFSRPEPALRYCWEASTSSCRPIASADGSGTMVGFSRRRQARGSNGPCVRTIRTRTRPSWASSTRSGCGLCPWNRNRKSSRFPWRPNKCASHRC